MGAAVRTDPDDWRAPIEALAGGDTLEHMLAFAARQGVASGTPAPTAGLDGDGRLVPRARRLPGAGLPGGPAAHRRAVAIPHEWG